KRGSEVRGGETRFGGKTILNKFNLTGGRRERMTLLCPPRSGKTTILRLIITLETLTGGYIYIDGQPLVYEQRGDKRVPVSKRQQKQLRTRIGMVFQQFNLFPKIGRASCRERV